MKKKNKEPEVVEVVQEAPQEERKVEVEIKPVNFDDFYQEIHDKVKCRRGRGQEIFLPFSVTQEQIKSIILKCREKMMVNWHLEFTEPDEKNPEPEVRMYWN